VFQDFFHGVWVDGHGSLYVCEVKARPGRVHKLERVGAGATGTGARPC
jgi:hypothetical protein